MDRLIEKFSKYLSESINGSEEDFERIDYMFKTYFYNYAKLIVLIIVFYLAGYFGEGLIGTVIVLITKPYYGGYHEDTHLKCFIASLCLISSAIYLGKVNELDYLNLAVMNAVSFYIIYNQVPLVDMDDEFVPSISLMEKNRRKAIYITLAIMALFVCCYKYKQYISIGSWIIMLQALTLFIKRGKRRTERI